MDIPSFTWIPDGSTVDLVLANTVDPVDVTCEFVFRDRHGDVIGRQDLDVRTATGRNAVSLAVAGPLMHGRNVCELVVRDTDGRSLT